MGNILLAIVVGIPALVLFVAAACLASDASKQAVDAGAVNYDNYLKPID